MHPIGDALHAVLLDIDGTLIESNDAHALAWVGALAAHGYIVTFEQVRRLIGMRGDKMLPALVGLDPESGEADHIGGSRSEQFRHELPGLRPTAGARDLLQLLRNEGLELVVATSAEASEVHSILEQAGVADLIATSASSGDAERSKPDPDIIQAALHKAGRSSAHAILLGDTAAALAIYDDPADLHRHFSTSPLSVRT